ncbi:MAG TPA: hypothetical protein DCM27_07950 [Rhodospirillaceae bacterium]|nr:hypothetical protein [Rhodospirillaceae bacterium]
MRIFSIMVSGVALFGFLSAGPVMARDDGGFGPARFSAQAPAALGGQAGSGQAGSGAGNVIAVAPVSVVGTTPADIEPAAGEEDITPEEEILTNDKVMQHSEDSSDSADRHE